jgi:hypothetical protein
MGHRITHAFESTQFSRFYPAGALRDTESLLTPAGDVQDILSLSSVISRVTRAYGVAPQRCSLRH